MSASGPEATQPQLTRRTTSFYRKHGLNLPVVEFRQVLAGIVGIHTALVFGFMCTSFLLANVDLAGVNVVMTGIVLFLYNFGLIMLLHKPPPPFQYGLVMGFSSILAFISLMNAVYWGQLSDCDEDENWIWGYSCYNQPAMKAIAVFGGLLFVTQFILVVALVAWIELLCPDYLAVPPAPEDESTLRAPDGRGDYGGVVQDAEGTTTLTPA